jgi:hypothetical protein
MLKVLERSELPIENTPSAPNLAPNESQKASRAEKRAAIDLALAADPNRTDRDIAQDLGVDHKTVGARRREIGISPPDEKWGNSDGAISPPDEPISQTRPATEAQAAKTKTRDADDFDWNNPDDVTLAEQRAVAVYRNRGGDLVIRQQNWPDDDSFIVISKQCEAEFIDRLTDACGIPTLRG